MDVHQSMKQVITVFSNCWDIIRGWQWKQGVIVVCWTAECCRSKPAGSDAQSHLQQKSTTKKINKNASSETEHFYYSIHPVRQLTFISHSNFVPLHAGSKQDWVHKPRQRAYTQQSPDREGYVSWLRLDDFLEWQLNDLCPIRGNRTLWLFG